VTSAHAGLTAIEAAAPAIDLIVSDVMMPGGMDGLSFAREVRRLYPRLPVVLASGYVEAVRTQAEQQGIPVLAKPYSLKDLAAVLGVAKRRARMES
jgi:CheY-like chemotaxis protein